MRTNDQYFKPGDKVMRVGCGDYQGHAFTCDVTTPQYGVVYCVEDFYEGPQFNAVMLVGFGGWRRKPGNPYPIGWEAKAFRMVEEIKLCVKAVERMKTPVLAND